MRQAPLMDAVPPWVTCTRCAPAASSYNGTSSNRTGVLFTPTDRNRLSPKVHPFSLEFTRDDNTVVISLSGEVDLATAPALHDALEEIVVHQGNLSVRVDLTGVTFMDSTGLNSLVVGLRDLRERGGHLAITNPRPAIVRLFELTGLSAVVDVTPGKDYPLGSDPTSTDHRSDLDGQAFSRQSDRL